MSPNYVNYRKWDFAAQLDLEALTGLHVREIRR